jgi:dTDP-glucose 4,6-dehydratase
MGHVVVSNNRSTTTANSGERFRLAMTNEVRDSVTMSDPSTRSRTGQTTLSRVLVTGGAGFVGGHLCQSLLDRGAQVLCVDDLSTSAPGAQTLLTERPGYRFLEHDVSHPLPPEYGNEFFDTVFHLASAASPVDYLRMPTATMRAGSRGTEVALEVAERCGARFVLASTSEVYGDPLEHPQQEHYWGNVNPIGPRSVYDEAKRYAEALSFAYLRERGLSIGVARIFNTYGPRMRTDDGRAVPTFFRQALSNEPITVSGNGSQTRSLCYVDDTVRGLISLALSDFTGPVNIGNPDELTVLRIAELVRDMAESASAIVFIPAVTDDPQRRCPDITVARDRLAWSPSVDYADGLAATLEWFRAGVDGRRTASSGRHA